MLQEAQMDCQETKWASMGATNGFTYFPILQQDCSLFFSEEYL